MVDVSPDRHATVIIHTSDWLTGYIEPTLESFTWNVMKTWRWRWRAHQMCSVEYQS